MKVKPRTEYEDQVAIFEWAAINESRWPCLALLYGSLMGAYLPIKLLNKYIKAGMKKDKPDINLPVPVGGHCGLWIELKRKGGALPNKGQQIMLVNLGMVGNATFACKGSDAAIEILIQYLTGRIRRLEPPVCNWWETTKPLYGQRNRISE